MPWCKIQISCPLDKFLASSNCSGLSFPARFLFIVFDEKAKCQHFINNSFSRAPYKRKLYKCENNKKHAITWNVKQKSRTLLHRTEAFPAYLDFCGQSI